MNTKRIEDMVGVLCFQREEYWCGMGSRRKPRHDGVHHRTRSQCSVNDARHDSDPLCRRTPPLRDW